MIKNVTGLLAVLVLAGWVVSAHATFIDYEFVPVPVDGGLLGGFTYDDTSMIFSNVSITEDVVNIESWNALTGNSLSAAGTGLFGSLLSLDFSPALALGAGPFQAAVSVASILGLIERRQVLNEVNPGGNVPAPATLALCSLGLAALGWSRRKA
jgi:hypothetical protein